MKPNWMRRWLLAAALYNAVWGLWLVFFPHAFSKAVHFEQAHANALWQCIGMFICIYGLGYVIAAYNPYRHWPIVFVGLLGKLVVPVGVIMAMISKSLPHTFFWIVLTSDLLWWLPFTLILYGIYTRWRDETYDTFRTQCLSQVLLRLLPEGDARLEKLTGEVPVLWLLVRHKGCTFCREALTKLKTQIERVFQLGLTLVVVHMSSDSDGQEMQTRYTLTRAIFVSDPERKLYHFFDLPRGKLRQLFCWKVLRRGFQAGILEKHGVGNVQGDGFQMHGAFITQENHILYSDRPASVADLPDIDALLDQWQRR